MIEQLFYSLDLNLIEYLWYRLKEFVYTRYLELIDVPGKDDNVYKAMIKAIIDVWLEVGD